MWIPFGFICEDRRQILAVGVFAFDVLQRRPDGAGKIAAGNVMATQAVSFAAVESEPSTLGRIGLRVHRTKRQRRGGDKRGREKSG